MKKLLVALGLSFLCGTASAETTKTVFNPFTGRLDYITKVTSTTLGTDAGLTANKCVQTDANGALSTAASTCGSGGGSSGLETIFGSAESSPTATLAGQQGDFTGSVSGSTMTFALDSTTTKFIHNQGTLQAGSTAYPDFVHVGTSMTVENNQGMAVNQGGGILLNYQSFPMGTNSQITWKEFGVVNGSLQYTDTNAPISGFKFLSGTTRQLGVFFVDGTLTGMAVTSSGTVRMYDKTNSHYVTLRAADTVGANVNWILPTADGSNGSPIVTDGSGNLSFSSSFNTTSTSASVTGSNGFGVVYGATVGSMTVSNLTSGQCVQTGTGGLLTVSGSACASTTGFGVLTATQTWSGQNNWTTPAQSTFTFGVTVGSLTVNGSGAGAIIGTEGTAITSASAQDILWADFSSHTWVFNTNQSQNYTVLGTTTTNTPGHVASWGNNGLTLIDGGTGGAGTPAAPVGSVQFNNASAFGGSNNFQWNGTSATLLAPLFVATTAQANVIVVSSSTTGLSLVAVSSTPVKNPADYFLSFSSPTVGGPIIFGVQFSGHVVSSGTTPTVSSCGTSPTMDPNSTDFAGTINTGSGSPTACTLTFASVFANTPVCIVSDDLQTSEPAVTTRSTSAITLTLGAALNSGHIFYICVGQKG